MSAFGQRRTCSAYRRLQPGLTRCPGRGDNFSMSQLPSVGVIPHAEQSTAQYIVSSFMNRRALLMIVAMLAASSCSSRDWVEIRNDAGFGVVIAACGERQRVGDGLTFDAAASCILPMEIESTFGRWRYISVNESETVPGLGAPTSGGHLVKLSLRADGTLAIIPSPGVQIARLLVPLRPECEQSGR
jgi:hypothetical protein